MEQAVRSDLYLQRGRLVGNRYEVLRPIGIGSMGAVYLVLDVLRQEEIALKVLTIPQSKKVHCSDEEYVARFHNEIDATRRVLSEFVVQVHDYVQEDGIIGYTMDYVPGGDLARLMGTFSPVPIPHAVRILIQACRGVSAIHNSGIIHRDLKPANLLLSESKDIKITDFGIARIPGLPRLTATGNLLGTFEYLSPQYLQDGEGTALCDIYALGIIAFEMLTGKVPFKAIGLFNMINAKVTQDPPLAHEINSECPPALSEIVAMALCRSTDQRYQSAEQMAEDLVLVDQTYSFADERSSLHLLDDTRLKAEISFSHIEVGAARPTEVGGRAVESIVNPFLEIPAEPQLRSCPRPRSRGRFYFAPSLSHAAFALSLALALILVLPSSFDLSELSNTQDTAPLLHEQIESPLLERARLGKALESQGLAVVSDSGPALIGASEFQPFILASVEDEEAGYSEVNQSFFSGAIAQPLINAEKTTTDEILLASIELDTEKELYITEPKAAKARVEPAQELSKVEAAKPAPRKVKPEIQVARKAEVDWSLGLVSLSKSEESQLASLPFAQKVKATLLSRFADYLAWPASVDARRGLCVIGKKSLAEYLFFQVAKHSGGAPSTLPVRQFSSIASASPGELCRLLYVPVGLSSLNPQLLKSLEAQNIALVGDDSGQGLIDFVLRDRKVKFTVNLERAKDADIRVSPLLVDLAVNLR